MLFFILKNTIPQGLSSVKTAFAVTHGYCLDQMSLLTSDT